MHKRKVYLIYRKDYIPEIHSFVKCYSKGKAWKIAKKMGEGTSVMVDVTTYLRPRTFWVSSTLYPLWEIYKE